jgi:hypothetical protein
VDFPLQLLGHTSGLARPWAGHARNRLLDQSSPSPAAVDMPVRPGAGSDSRAQPDVGHSSGAREIRRLIRQLAHVSNYLHGPGDDKHRPDLEWDLIARFSDRVPHYHLWTTTKVCRLQTIVSLIPLCAVWSRRAVCLLRYSPRVGHAETARRGRTLPAEVRHPRHFTSFPGIQAQTIPKLFSPEWPLHLRSWDARSAIDSLCIGTVGSHYYLNAR